MPRTYQIISLLCGILSLLVGCDGTPNSPYPESGRAGNVYYTSFTERPRYLDPVKSYNTNESAFTAQIYEPPLQYDYLKRPYELIPLSAAQMPKVTYLDVHRRPLPDNVDPGRVAYTLYEIEILPGMRYQPHPAFAKDEQGAYRYHHLAPEALAGIKTLADFEHTGTRVVTAEDFVYEMKRFANPELNSPIYGVMKEYIVGLSALHDAWAPGKACEGVRATDDTHYQILIQGKYEPFLYWLAMPFFAPMPWEADVFYNNPALIKKNIVLDWFPIGSGPYYLAENNPNHRMVLQRNPYFHGETYPSQGTAEQRAQGLLNDAGKPLPMIDTAIFTLEKEDIPRWNKFLQGYYDNSGLTSDNFNQAIQVHAGQSTLTPMLKEKGITVLSDTRVATFYWGFNMLDALVGGDSERARKLRQAISIAVDMEEYISIFLNERAVAAHSIIPPAIYGYEAPPAGLNPYVYEWKEGNVVRRSLDDAKQLLREAGYPNGIDPKTGKALIMYFDVSSQGDPEEKAQFAWMRKQFSKLGIQLNVRATDYNRFLQKLEEGYAQMFRLGWVADYPDPENFFMILYSAHGKKLKGGVNSTNYANPEFDALFQKIRQTKNSDERLHQIQAMIRILQKDMPMIWGYYPEEFILKQTWYENIVVGGMADNTLKYQKVDGSERMKIQAKENKPIFWPALLVLMIVIISIVPVLREYIKRERTQHARRIKQP